ncbi:hypothetical protein G647_09986 [Cladophialophora carrionii CBS 160.54]|uniref:Uncharacterized protein n=1 Tax=Cladophialophora carrionii CBS 160.54 TaxID=1279043 RepID=V9DLS4_9EURO|nr:uncharacterized protein G647_09986 [Cladophialophora carrionii CBS 160.54]ETI26887.1 hypothetical protein G647_09986 [Cladophialophora carrionii CBS 160.54]
MSRTAARSKHASRGEGAVDEVRPGDTLPSKVPRQITVYDAVAGRAGLNGFLTQQQRLSENVLPISPEAVFLGRTTVPEDVIHQQYDLSSTLPGSSKLPESEMLKAIHTYASDFYASAAAQGGKFDFKSLDETALIAIGVLLEEAVKEALGQNGDMVFVEPEGLENGLGETKLTKYQVQGRVRPARAAGLEQDDDQDEDSLREDESPAKKQRR